MGIQLGQGGLDGANPLIGSLDEFRLWTKALTDAEIIDNMNNNVSSAAYPTNHLTTTWADIKMR